jgi:hypothetical protein
MIMPYILNESDVRKYSLFQNILLKIFDEFQVSFIIILSIYLTIEYIKIFIVSIFISLSLYLPLVFYFYRVEILKFIEVR